MPVPAGAPSGKCTLCGHAERVRVELQLAAGGASLNAIARKYGISRHALGRHWARHVSEARRAALVLGPVKQISLAAQVSEEASSVIDHYRAVRAGLYKLYDAALEAGDRNGGALVAGRLLTCLNAMAQLTGQIANSPLMVQHNHNSVHFHLSPEFARFQGDLIRALSRFPQAMEAVIAEFERLERASVPTESRVIEHQPDEVSHAEASD
jgi:transposase-like protein